MQIRKTKIVCSLGPASSTDEVVQDLILAGMNVARLNFSHGTHQSHLESIERVRRVSDKLGIPVAILLDTKGPEIRTGTVKDDGKITINSGDTVDITVDDCLCTEADGGGNHRISISWKEATAKLKAGHRILIADGLLDLQVLEVAGEIIRCRAGNAATIGSKKNVNLLGVHARLPIMNEQDEKDIAFGAEQGVDYLAASFLSFPAEVNEIRRYLDGLNSRMKIIAKIENGEGLENIGEIARVADGVMVARGDLGVQLPTEEIPLAQKYIISTCRRVGTPVITATQMLESMIVNPRPTRAELTDVANAIFDGTDAVMLSGETASGTYPVEAVKMMDKIARTVEASKEFRDHMKVFHDECFSLSRETTENLGTIMSKAGVKIAAEIGAKAIVTPTTSGNTARILSVFRPNEPILAVTLSRHAERALQLVWGVHTCRSPRVDETESMMQNAMAIAMESGIAEISDKIVLVAGLPLSSPNMINTIRVIILGTVLVRTHSGGAGNPELTQVRGKLVHAASADEARTKLTPNSNEILVCRELTEEYVPIVSMVKGIVCEGSSDISDERLTAINPNLLWLTGARDALKKLEYGITVTLDATQLLVYEGSIMAKKPPAEFT